MAQNDFLVWAGGSGANVMSQTTYSSLPYIGTGVVDGIASAPHANKAWRQSSIIAATIGALLNSAAGADAVDDGTTAALLGGLQQAIANIGVASVTGITGAAHTYMMADEGKLIQRSNAGTMMWDLLPTASSGTVAPGGLLTIRNADRSALLVVASQSLESSLDGSVIGKVILGPGQVARIVGDGAGNYFCVERPARTKLGSNVVLFVNTNGTDSSSGLTQSEAMLTGQAAVNRLLREYDFNGFASAIGFGNGTFSGSINIPYAPVGAPQGFCIALNGQGSNSTILTTTAGATLTVTHTTIIMSQLTIQNPGTSQFLPYASAGYALNVGSGGGVGIDQGIAFGPCGAVQIACSGGGQITTGGNPYTITGGAGYHVVCGAGGHFVPVDSTITLVGTPAFSKSFAYCYGGGCFEIWGSNFVGSATGTRFVVTSNASIMTAGMGLNFLPGNAPGVQTDGGSYS